MSTSALLWGVLFGSIGFGYVLYGRKQRAAVPFTAGVVLMVFPYFISNTYLLVALGVAFAALPFVIRS